MSKGQTYKVISSGYIETLVQQVNAHLNKDWDLVGGIQIKNTDAPGMSCIYYQTLVIVGDPN